jgi:hypothetical protein
MQSLRRIVASARTAGCYRCRVRISMLVACVIGAAAPTADARGIDFHIYGKRAATAETARVLRCDPQLQAKLAKSGAVVSCREVKGVGTVAGIVRAGELTLALVDEQGKTAWRRPLGKVTVAFATDLLVVVEAGKGYRAVWFAAKDGRIVDDVTFAPTATPHTPPDWCGDRIVGTYRSTDKASQLAAVCLVLD